ncbi:hypothetical protein GCM10017083_47750 [Thalassobaculum fulvum]|uniref:Motility protein B-like N-terminal domain-containing protein n=1 Tax=Thalassobaculum fulvum TaxID=1633335 RepID=A0A919CS55_9PROT|nr:hypothetical protein [Thalassobaculum fulvum]GHD60983.1 hypothetical protein GCM10017083_47750 [Thalassobaculum fulvum]
MSLSRPTPREPDKGASQPLFLSLFLLLLAFFILLNSLSTIEPGRSNRVLESVQRAFPSQFRTRLGDGVLEADPGQVIGETVRAGIGTIFRQVLPVARVTVEPDGNPIYVSAPVARVYSSATGGMTPVGEQLATRLAPLLATPPAGSVLELDVLFTVADDARGTVREARGQAVSDLVDRFVAAGIEPALVSAGLEPGQSDTVRFVFRTRPGGPAAGGG